jgi:hypothetical protein
MDRERDGQRDGLIEEGWKDGGMDKEEDGWTKGGRDSDRNEQRQIWTGGWINGWMDR